MQGSILYAHAPSYIFMPLLYSLHIHPPFKMSTTEFLYKQNRVSINQWIDKTVKNHIIALNVKWKTNTALAPPPHPLHSLVHPQRQNCKGKSLKDRSWQEAEKNVTSWKSGRDEPCSRCVCVCVFLQTVSSLGVYSSRTSRTFTSSHLLTLLPKSQHHCILLLSFSISTFLFQDPKF